MSAAASSFCTECQTVQAMDERGQCIRCGSFLRACTCHPDDHPPMPCARKYALAECLAENRRRLYQTPPCTQINPWQVKIGGIWWRVKFAPWYSFHQPQSEPHLRRAWWWMVQWNRFGNYAIRICGVTLMGRDVPWDRWVL